MAKFKKVLLIFIAFKLTVLLAYLIYVSVPLNLLHFEHLATEDIQFNDIYYATKLNNNFQGNKEVVLINTGSIKNDTLFRKNLASLINKIAEFKPKTIGLDFVFEKYKNKQNDSLLNQSIVDNSVITVIDSRNNHKNIFKNSKFAIANFPGKNGETQREYYNYFLLGKDTIPSFAAALTNIRSNDSKDYLKYATTQKGFYNILNNDEKIWTDNIPAIEGRDILNVISNIKIKEAILNKIVIIGHLGNENMENEFDIEDKFRVPTDASLFNRNLTMPGAVIHTNAVQMMLNDDKIFAVEGWLYEFINSIILFVFLFIFYSIHHKFYLSKLINILIILVSTIPIILISCVYLMNIGIYYKVGSLFMQIAFLDEFVDIADGFSRKFNKNKKSIHV